MGELYVSEGYYAEGYTQSGIYIDWGTLTIHVPKSETELIQSTPTEVRELELNKFRLTLKDLEDDVDGMAFLRTHKHNTEVLLSGLTYARVVEIINGYTITFEDGQYAVNLVGANSNVQDNVNVNQVSVRSSNSAGMTSSPDIEYSSFNGHVTIDVTSSYDGAIFPTGTPRAPVNNIPDAKLIAEYRGFDAFYIIGDITVGTGDDISGFVVTGQAPSKSTITVLDEAYASGCIFKDCTLTGVLDGNNTVQDSVIYNMSYIDGYVYNCLIAEVGEIVLGDSTKSYFLNCYSGTGTIYGEGEPTIDCGGSGAVLVMHNYNGNITIKNKTGVEAALINLNAGSIELQASCTAGTIQCEGTGSLEDYTGIGCVVYSENLMNADNIASATLSSNLDEYSEPGTLGEASLQVYYNGYIAVDSVNGTAGTDYPVGTRNNPVNNIADAYTLSHRFNIFAFGFSSDSYTFLGTDSLRGYRLFSQSGGETLVNITDGCDTNSAYFECVNVHGTLTGRCVMKDCLIRTLHGFEGIITDSYFEEGSILEFAENNTVKSYINNCVSVATSGGYPILDLTYIGTEDVIVTNHTGAIKVAGKTQNQLTPIVLVQGIVSIDATCTNGILKVAGDGLIGVDETGGTIVNIDNLFNPDTISHAVLDHPFSHDGITHYEHGSLGGLTAREAFAGVVTLDTVDGSPGTTFPAGMPHQPVDNIEDAITILTDWHFDTIELNNDITVPASTNLNGITFIAGATIDRTMTIPATCTTNGTIFKNIIITGTLNGRTELYSCEVEELAGFAGTMDGCTLYDLIEVEPSGRNSMLKNCVSGGVSSTWVSLDINGSAVEVRGYCGNIELIGKTSVGITGISLSCGIVKIADTCIAGEIKIGGIGSVLEDLSGIDCLVDDRLLSNAGITETVWNYERV